MAFVMSGWDQRYDLDDYARHMFDKETRHTATESIVFGVALLAVITLVVAALLVAAFG